MTISRTVTMLPHVLFQEMDKEAIVLNLEGEYYYSINESGVRMWQLLAEHGKVPTVIEHLLNEYAVDAATLRHDLDNFIAWLMERKLVEVERIGAH